MDLHWARVQQQQQQQQQSKGSNSSQAQQHKQCPDQQKPGSGYLQQLTWSEHMKNSDLKVCVTGMASEWCLKGRMQKFQQDFMKISKYSASRNAESTVCVHGSGQPWPYGKLKEGTKHAAAAILRTSA
jgi:hypothetical protein